MSMRRWLIATCLPSLVLGSACRQDDARPADDVDAPAITDVADSAVANPDLAPNETAADVPITPDTSVTDSGAPDDTTAPDETGTRDAGDVAPVLPADAWQAVAIPACDGLAPGSKDCHYRLLWRPAACGGGACSGLMIYWSGGEQGCADGNYDVLLEKWADSGLLVACAQPYTTSAETGRYPYVDELERMDLLTRRLRAHAASAWDGRYLVIGGVSHGASAPLAGIAKSRAFVDRAATWTGRDGTAVLMFDGISDPARLEASVGLSGREGCGLLHSRFVGRYGPASPLVHDCGNRACFCAGGGSGWDRDTTVIGQSAGPNWPASPYTCADIGTPTQRVQYRVVSCGGGQAEPCGLLGDVIPDEQQTRLVDALSTCRDVDVSYIDHPGCAHTLCGAWDFCGGKRAREWLTSLGW